MNGYRQDRDRHGSERNQTSLAWFLGRMFMIPFQTFVYGMERIVEAMRRLETTTGSGVLLIAGGSAEDSPVEPCRRDEPGNGPDEPGNPDVETQTAPGGPESSQADREEKTTMDKNLNDDMLKLVRFKILFVKRGYEHAFPEQEALVYDNIDGSAFTAWKVAEFIQSLGRRETHVPHSWGHSYPPADRNEKNEGTYRDAHTLLGFPEDDKKYLRVYYEVLERFHREKFRYEERQIEVLEEIRDRMKPC